ncbi:universal stress protein [Sedimenticola selenatireducens]|uniref:Universal stress protein n=1 Tax=Sedimenticola selenatireducens TaxID=191960 RepID=A0A2N6CWD1_9GAMM|nr:universal stress protein [Sedimenticola selenatireducens]PLX61572.1 MAG: universal stress protein [Sedimenticola selenatireducens]
MLNELKCILYASYFGSDSRKGFRMAVTLARTNQARLIFMHVIEPLGQRAERLINSYMTEAQFKAQETEGIEIIREEITVRIQKFSAEELPSDYEFSHNPPECRIEQGRPVEQIIRVAKEIDADLIVMGTRTHSALSQILVGSTAHQMLFYSDRPVLVVPMEGDHNC